MWRGLHCKRLTWARCSRTHSNCAADEAIEQSDDVSLIGGSISGMGAEAVIPARPVPISYESIFLC